MNWKTILIAAALVVPAGSVSAQTTSAQTTPPANTPAPLLSGTTDGLPWGLYPGGLTDLQEGENRLRLSAPADARVLGTRYSGGDRPAALITYRAAGGLDARSALAFATNQLQRQGFDLTSRAYPDSNQARALLRRQERLIEVHILQGATGNLQALYLFRGGNLPQRLLVDQAPSSLQVYAEPIDLSTVAIQPGRIFLTPPGDVLIDITSYRDATASMLFFGNYTLQQLEDFYLPFFRDQGFIETTQQDLGGQARAYQLSRDGNTYTLTLNASDATSRARVTLAAQ
jgi:hypothetical protein